MLNLNESLYLMAGAFDLFPDAIIVVNKNGIIKNANKQIHTIFGYSEEEIKGQELAVLLPERFRDKHPHFVASFFDKASIRKMGAGTSLFGRHKSGTEMNIDIALSVIDTGAEKYALAVIRDISDKMNLVNRITSIEKIKNELEQFAYILTHDLKAPLQRVKVLTHLINLELSEKESEEVKTIINYLNDSVLGMESLILGVLDYQKAKLEKNTVEVDVNLNDIFNQVLKMITVPGNFTIKTMQPLPILKGNSTMLLQVFLNLINNAILHNTKPFGILEIDWERNDKEIELSFSDNGIIIAPYLREKIFDITTQLDNKKPKDTHGIGLSIVKQVIENNKNGKVWYEPSQIGGSCFKFTWPVEN